jgi:putative ABC transport system permease protein
MSSSLRSPEASPPKPQIGSKAIPAKPAVPVASQETVLQNMMEQFRVQKRRRGNMLGAIFISAAESIWANRTRSFLTTLGIFIGVAAVIAVLTLTQGASAYVTNTISSLGANTVIVSPGNLAGRGAITKGAAQTLTSSDADSISHLAHVQDVSPIVSTSTQAVFNGKNWHTTVEGVSENFPNIDAWDVAQGLWFSAGDIDASRPVAVLGVTVAQNLFGTDSDPIGQQIRLGSQTFRVAGVLTAKGGFGQDDVVFVPFSTAQVRLVNSPYVQEILVGVDASNNVTLAQQAITLKLEQTHHLAKGTPDDFKTTSSTEILAQAQQQVQAFSFLLVGIAGISLTVGGIGIMNIMLVSVTERTREIGIRMSIGARRSDIRNQFLIEALLLCLLGGAVGLALGLLAGWGVVSLVGIPYAVTAFTIVVPLAVAGGVGVLFGLYPAVRAARLDPITALRKK